MDKIQELKDIALKNNFCQGGMSQLLDCENYDQLIDCFFDRIDTCLALNFPTKRMFLTKFYPQAKAGNILVNEKIKLENPERVAFLGKCDAYITVDGFSVSAVYVKHTSKVHIDASENAVVMVDALDSSCVTVESKDSARVIVNLYSKAQATGDAKIINKGKETYDL